MDNNYCGPKVFRMPRWHLINLSPSFTLLTITFLLCIACTHKIQAEDECSSAQVLCYECDSRYDPNCADPFDFSPTATLEAIVKPQTTTATTKLTDNNNETTTNRQANDPTNIPLNSTSTSPNDINSTIPIRIPKKLPGTTLCQGCCVKLTSKMPDGTIYVKRTCTRMLDINFFMVGLVCMKERDDRGKMCFCESDYCNGQSSIHLYGSENLFIFLILLYVIQSLLL